MKQVAVPALSRDCPAHRALATEGVDHQVFIMETDLSYGHLLSDLWETGEGFTIVEHDVVPFPGAVQGLEECDQPWCVHWFPFAKNVIRPALGLVRFSDELVRRHQFLPGDWSGANWWELDGKVYPALIRLVGHPHRHLPDVAHLREQP